MVFDVEQHKQNQMRFLEALYNLVQEHIATHDEGNDPTMVYETEERIGERARLTNNEADRIGSELLRYDFLEAIAGEEGPSYSLTQSGLEEIENYLYEQSPLAKRRWMKRWVAEKAAELAQVGAGKLLAATGAFILSAIAIYRVEAIAWAIRHLAGQ